MSLKINDQTTWWAAKPDHVIDARDISSVKVTKVPGVDGRYLMRIQYSGVGDRSTEFPYESLEELNVVLKKLGLEWQCPVITT